MIIQKPSEKQLRLRALVQSRAGEAAATCAWCAACQSGAVDSTSIPKPSAPQCAEHAALNAEWSRWFRTAPIGAASIGDSITARGLEIARRRMTAEILEVA